MSIGIAHVAAVGASTPVGRDAWATAAAVRAGVSGYSQHPYLLDSRGEPLTVAVASWLDPEVSGVSRLRALLSPALDQVLGVLAAAEPGLKTALALALPVSRPGLAPDFTSELARAIQADYPGAFAVTALFPKGHAAGLLALEAVMRKFAQGAFEACVLAGVESYLEPATLDWLEETDRLHGAGPLNNAWGFIPGEGAGALLLVDGRAADRLDGPYLARVLGVGTGKEDQRIRTDTVCIGEGLTEAFRGALGALTPGDTVSDVYCDMNGEPYRADEYGFTCLRTREFFRSAADFVAPADCWGDVSAAGVPLHIALAAIAGNKGYANGPLACVWASSEEGDRGAAVLRVSYGEADAG